jgi:NNP family nitrate/nitrite transporter-like MFS transporter
METKTFRQGLIPLFLIILIFFFRGFARALLSPLLLDLEREFSLSHTQSAKFFIYFSLGASVATILSGFVSARIRHRGTVLLSSVIHVVALLFMSSSISVWMLHIGLIIMGIGSGLYPPSGMSMITGMLEKRDWQKALAWHELGPHFAMAIVPLFTVAFQPYLSWRGIFVVTAGGYLIATLIFNRYVTVGYEAGEPPTFTNLIPLIRLPSFWIFMLFLGFALGSIQGIYLLIPTFMITEAGFSPMYTNTVFGISRFIPIASLLVGGFVLGRMGIRKTLFVMMILAGASIVGLGLFSGPLLTLIIFLQPAFGALAVPAVLSAISETGPKASRNIALSMTIPVASFMGNGGIPAFAGFMGDAISFSAGFMVIGMVMVVLAFLSIFIRLGTHEG